jgi:FkbM family methyltransferase
LEYEDMSFLLHLLRANDLFVDIGANVGVYTVLASGEIGANSISIEPIPTTFSHLSENITLNDISSKVIAFNIGLGSKPGKLFFTKDKDTVNHVSTEADKHTMEVQVNTLDNILQTRSPILIKIDVEGFETEVLKGSSSTLSNPALKAIIIELNGSGNRYGYDENTIHDQLLSHGFQPFSYAPKNRTLHLLPTYNNLNTIYIRDIDFVASRVKEARKVKVGRHYI